MAAAVISPGRHLADLVREHGVDRVTVIPTAVDIEQFAPRPKDPALLQALEIPDAVVVTHVSNLKPVKRPMDLVESASAAIRRDGRLVYLIVGDGPLRGPMESACRDAGIQHRFRFVGWVDHAEIPAYLNLADMVVMPSEWEALARAYVETQACGRALVASDIRAAREVIVDGETGVLFRPGDVADLTEKILALAGAPERRPRSAGRRARGSAPMRSTAPWRRTSGSCGAGAAAARGDAVASDGGRSEDGARHHAGRAGPTRPAATRWTTRAGTSPPGAPPPPSTDARSGRRAHRRDAAGAMRVARASRPAPSGVANQDDRVDAWSAMPLTLGSGRARSAVPPERGGTTTRAA